MNQRRALLLAVLTVFACGVSTVAYGFMSAVTTRGATDPTVRAGLPQAATPSVSVSGNQVTVSIPQITVNGSLLGTYAGGGYRVKRYVDGQAASTAVTPGGTCADLVSGSAATLTCNDTVTTTATYRYVVHAALNAFDGAASTASAAVLVTAGPAAPTGLSTTPTSPSNSVSPTVTGTAGGGSLVRLYVNSTCSLPAKDAAGASVSGTAATGGNFSFVVRVTANATTTFYATATTSNGTSPCSTSTVSYTVDTIAPTATSWRGVNAAGGAGIIAAGDYMDFTFSEQMRTTTILSGWASGTSATVNVQITNSGGGSGKADTVQVRAGTTTTVLATLGTVNTNTNFVGTSANFSATMTMTGGVVRVTLGARTAGAVNTGAAAAGAPVWTFGANMTDLAGNALPAGSVTGASAVQF